MSSLEIGSLVEARYKTGVYAGEISEDRGKYYLVRMLAVLKHPLQGDLHNPGETEQVFFHERRALSYTEKANVPKSAVKPYQEEVPDYQASLKQALAAYQQKMSAENSVYAQLVREKLQILEKDYFG